MRINQLRSLCDYWVNRLNLKEWYISVRWATKEESKVHQGGCKWNTEELKAAVYISHNGNANVEVEETLVHELLHVVLDGHIDFDDWKYDVNRERAINRIAAALVNPEMRIEVDV